ncbi:MAG: hypothetical protein ACI91J_003410, partial [Yoonia sp.]
MSTLAKLGRIRNSVDVQTEPAAKVRIGHPADLCSAEIGR